MSFAETALLGAVAGLTIFLGLPVGRMSSLSQRARVALAMFSVGVLVFLLVDVVGHGFGIAEEAVTAFRDGRGGAGRALALSLLLIGGFALGSAGLGLVARGLRRPTSLRPMAGGSVDMEIPVSDPTTLTHVDQKRARALQTGLVVAAAIGLHNFAEGLAIGVSARSGEIGLATVLIIGFALHNATEGFGIVGPLGEVRPSWRWLGLAGLIAGGPTFLGSMLGYQVASPALELVFYSVAGGAILYVIGEIWQGMRRYGHRELGLALLAAGFAVGVLTDFVVVYGGG